MDGLTQSLIDDVVHLAQVNHQFFLLGALEGPNFFEHSEEVGRAKFARVKLAKEHEEGVPFLDQSRSQLFWETTGHHVQDSPAHAPQFLSCNVMLPFIDQFFFIFVDFLLPEFLPEGQHVSRQQLIFVEESVFNNILSGIVPIKQKTSNHEDKNSHRYEPVSRSGLDLADHLIFDLILLFEGGLKVMPVHGYVSQYNDINSILAYQIIQHPI